MTRISLILALLAANAAAADLMSGTATVNGAQLSYKTVLEPPTPGLSRVGGGTLTDKNVIKRHLCDFAEKTYFGYDFTMEPQPDGRVRVTFGPLTITPEKMEQIFSNVKGWRMLALPQAPATQVLRPGDTIALDLFVNPATGQKIVDYITVQIVQSRTLTASGPARDFSVAEGALDISAPRLSINRKPAGAWAGVMIGSPVWIYIPGRGRFIFSLEPRPDLGLQKTGEIRGSTLEWRWGGDQFSLSTERRIAPGEAAYNLYVFHDPAYRMRGEDASAGFILGAGGRLDSLVRR
ncbi:MAG TPA: hypothetical protein VFL57_03210 [Bryobacteraceae bacterium]|nr:hypothetical protein [Bryobacteraceae bacterium]